VGALLTVAAAGAHAARLKDLSRIDGVRANQLIGFGLVGGLAGTGDDPKSAPYTAEAIANMLNSFGFAATPAQIKVKNFAAVIVTADMPPFVKPGDRLDVTVSSVGTATSLAGGTLFQTLLRGLDGQVYAVAQGQVSLGRPVSQGRATAAQYSTVGRIPEGATIEAAVPATFLKPDGVVRINLNDPDFTTASRVVDAINRALSEEAAYAEDAGTITVRPPAFFAGRTIAFISLLESLDVDSDMPARVVINERTGTVVLGGTVEILPVAVSHQGLQVQVLPAFAEEAGAAPAEAAAALSRVTTKDVVEGLNALGATPQDIVAIFQALAASGALLGELVIM